MKPKDSEPSAADGAGLSSVLLAPVELQCEYLTDPLGVDARCPRFAWALRAQRRGQLQHAYQILVSNRRESLAKGVGNLWDSGKVASAETIQIEYAGAPLTSRTRCWWAVRSWDTAGAPTPFSDPATFEMGLLEPEDWKAQWIGADEAVSAPQFRREFQVTKTVASARAYVCGLGYYELRLNGQKVGDHVLDPNWTDYDDRDYRDMLYPYEDRGRRRVFYVTYDVTAALARGRNCMGAILGNGMHNQRLRVVEGKMWYGPPRLLLQVEVVYEDGTRETVTSDTSWRCSPSPITFNNVFVGEIYDSRLDQPGWDRPGFDDTPWPHALPVRPPIGSLQSQLSLPDRVRGYLAPKSLAEPRPGLFIFDLGQNFSGWVRLAVDGPAGAAVTLRFAEELTPEGLLDMRSVSCEFTPEQVQRDVYILNGKGPATYEPRFVWHGFRYVEVTGFPGTPTLATITGCVVHSDVEVAGEFGCSEPLLCQINEAFRRSMLSNYHGGVPSDCPAREKLGYTADGQLTAEAAMCNFRVAQFYAKWLDDIIAAQHPETGYVPHTVPFYGGGGGHAWGSAIIIVAWHLYQYYGDRRMLVRAYPAMQKWLAFQASCADADGIVDRECPGSWCLGDWAMPGGFVVGTSNELPNALPNTAYYGFNTRLMARVAGILGQLEDVAGYQDLADRIAAAFHRRFYDSTRGCYARGLHGAEAFALALGAVPPAEEPRVLAHLLAHLRERDCHLDTGILGTPILLDVLAQRGKLDAALAVLTQTTYPSFGYMLARGATTLWENWDEAQGSHNHPMYGSVSAWFYRELAGIRVDPSRPGFGAVTIQPPACGLANASASLRTQRGVVAAAWRRTESEFHLDVTIPRGAQARIVLSTAEMRTPVLREGGAAIPLYAGKPGSEGVFSVGVEGKTITLEVGGGDYRFSVSSS